VNLSHLCKPDTINHDITSKVNQIPKGIFWYQGTAYATDQLSVLFFLFGLKTQILHNRLIFSDIMCFNDAEKTIEMTQSMGQNY